MTDRIDISKTVDALCKTFGLPDRNLIGAIDLRPGTITFRVFRLNEDGKKFVDDNGKVASDLLEFPVRT